MTNYLNGRGYNCLLRASTLATNGQKTWLDFKNALPQGTLSKFTLFVHNLSTPLLLSQYHIRLQLWQPVDTTTFQFRLYWESRQTIIANYSRGALYEVR